MRETGRRAGRRRGRPGPAWRRLLADAAHWAREAGGWVLFALLAVAACAGFGALCAALWYLAGRLVG